jgi:hypothetical protein
MVRIHLAPHSAPDLGERGVAAALELDSTALGGPSSRDSTCTVLLPQACMEPAGVGDLCSPLSVLSREHGDAAGFELGGNLRQCSSDQRGPRFGCEWICSANEDERGSLCARTGEQRAEVSVLRDDHTLFVKG